jgi:hypothetical protein
MQPLRCPCSPVAVHAAPALSPRAKSRGRREPQDGRNPGNLRMVAIPDKLGMTARATRVPERAWRGSPVAVTPSEVEGPPTTSGWSQSREPQDGRYRQARDDSEGNARAGTCLSRQPRRCHPERSRGAAANLRMVAIPTTSGWSLSRQPRDGRNPSTSSG